MHVEDPVEKIQAVTNRLQKANGWSCSLRQWHPRWFACDCLSNPYRPSKGVVTAHTLVGVATPTVNGCDADANDYEIRKQEKASLCNINCVAVSVHACTTAW